MRETGDALKEKQRNCLTALGLAFPVSLFTLYSLPFPFLPFPVIRSTFSNLRFPGFSFFRFPIPVFRFTFLRITPPPRKSPADFCTAPHSLFHIPRQNHLLLMGLTSPPPPAKPSEPPLLAHCVSYIPNEHLIPRPRKSPADSCTAPHSHSVCPRQNHLLLIGAHVAPSTGKAVGASPSRSLE